MTTTGLTKGLGWEIGVARVLPADPATLWELLTSGPGTAVWLGEGIELPHQAGRSFGSPGGTYGEVRSFRPMDQVRLTWQPCGWGHESTLHMALSPTADGTTVRFHQDGLAGPQEREVQRYHWKAVLDRLEQLLPR